MWISRDKYMTFSQKVRELRAVDPHNTNRVLNLDCTSPHVGEYTKLMPVRSHQNDLSI